MLRRIMAVGSAALLAFTVATTPLYAADLGMPTKAPVYKAPPEAVEEFCWPCVLALLAAAGLGVCLAECGCLKSCETHHQCVTTPCS
jgi:hypothetical protein